MTTVPALQYNWFRYANCRARTVFRMLLIVSMRIVPYHTLLVLWICYSCCCCCCCCCGCWCCSFVRTILAGMAPPKLRNVPRARATVRSTISVIPYLSMWCDRRREALSCIGFLLPTQTQQRWSMWCDDAENEISSFWEYNCMWIAIFVTRKSKRHFNFRCSCTLLRNEIKQKKTISNILIDFIWHVIHHCARFQRMKTSK